MKASVNLSEKWIGARFGKLVVIGFGYDDKRQNNTWKCRCDCGKEVEVLPGNEKAGRVHSCGCAQIESATKHGQRNTRLYQIWVGMRRRCTDANHVNYANYGAIGIHVCDEWESFDSFFKWAIENGYQDDLSIDRIDVHGNYEPSNCRWATAKVQSNNRRNTRYVNVFGETLCVGDAIEKYGNGIRRDTFLRRIDHYGFSAEEALTKEVRKS